MSLYDEQIRQRYENDEKLMASSYDAAVNAVMGRSFSLDGIYPENAIGQVLRFFHTAVPSVKNADETPEHKLDHILRSVGIMKRNVVLKNDWYDSSWGVYLVKRKDTGEITSVIPASTRRLGYFDSGRGRLVKITKHNADIFEKDALQLYRPFPLRGLSLKDLAAFCFQSWSAGDIVFAIVMLIASTVLGLFVPKISYFLFSQVTVNKDVTLLASTLVFSVCISIAAAFFTFIYRVITEGIGVKMRASVQSALMMRLLGMPLSFFEKYNAGNISERLSGMQDFCIRFIGSVVISGMTAIFSLAYFSQVVLYTPELAMPTLCIILVNIVFLVVSGVLQYKVNRTYMELSAKNSGMAFDTITGIEKIKLAGAERRMFARYGRDFANVARVAYNPPLAVKLISPIALAIILVGQFALYYIAIENVIGYAEYYAFQTAYGSISGGLTALAAAVTASTSLIGSFTMMRPLMETVPEVNEELKVVNDVLGNVELNNVSFRYEDSMKDIISSLSLQIRQGEYVAIVGKSGCGKSTLVRLLLGFVRPRAGAIYYDGKDLAKLEKATLRKKIGTVMQNDALFNGSIFENITICAPGATLDDAWEAARLAGIADDIAEMPMGMHTQIGEGSGGLSGGQRQRLIIARALAPKPKLLIFDEATSALDNLTQKKISDALDTLKCTRIVIAHRLSTIKNCDRILFMEGGRIVEEGNYDQLIALKGRFADLVERQRLDV